jgi:hypothetical protein
MRLMTMCSAMAIACTVGVGQASRLSPAPSESAFVAVSRTVPLEGCRNQVSRF